jgi:hypothetical protein
VKPRKVKGIDTAAPLADNAERIVRVRLEELLAHAERALDSGRSGPLHDMRIAAKRLRYVLELTAFCFGPYAKTGAKRAKDLQELLGDIHDCDVMLPRVARHVEELREGDAAVLRALAAGAADLEPELAARAPQRGAYGGLELLATWLQARRGLLLERTRERWARLEREGFARRLESALAERAPAAGNGDPGAQASTATIDSGARRAARGGTSQTPIRPEG